MRLVWWVRGPLEIVERPITTQTCLPNISLGNSTAYYSENDTCPYSGRKGLVTERAFEEQIDAYNKADELRVARIERIDQELNWLQEERERLINAEIKEVFYGSILIDLAEKEKARLLKQVSA